MSGTHRSSTRTWRLGVVSYLNAKPLVQGLEADGAVELVFEVPARLPALLDDGKVDAALVPVIDFGREGCTWQIVSDACIGCHGESLTVRVFSHAEPASIRTLHVDGDSHTSVALARIIWHERFDRDLRIVPFRGDETVEECEAILLIGDKVVHNTLIDYDIQTDLGSAWRSLTSLPFVFAAWAAPAGIDAAPLADRLARARDAGVASAELIAADFGPGMGWPVELAKRYLTARMHYTLGARERLGLTKFFELACLRGVVSAAHGLEFA